MFKRLLKYIPYKQLTSKKFVIGRNKEIRKMEFGVWLNSAIGASAPMWHTIPEQKLADLYLLHNKNKIKAGWEFEFPNGLNNDLRFELNWNSPSDTVVANPPFIRPDSKLMIWVWETVERKGMKIKGDKLTNFKIKCKQCKKTYDVPVIKCDQCNGTVFE